MKGQDYFTVNINIRGLTMPAEVNYCDVELC